MNVRRLAAIDMHGIRGTRLRRRLVTAEFVLGAVAATVFGAWLTTKGAVVYGLWVVGVGLNYVPLAVYALVLRRDGRLQAELAGVDINQEARRYSVLQLWIFVPLSLVVLTLRDGLNRHPA